MATELIPEAKDALSPKPDAVELPAETVLRAPHGWQMINFVELWHFRDLLYFLAWRDVKIRYKQTILGVAWAVLQPAMMMVIFTIVFSLVTDSYKGDDYPLFVLSGLLPWSFFATAITNAGNSVVGSERLVTKIYFPRLAVPFASVGAAIVDFLVAFPLLFLLFPFYAERPSGLGILILPVIFVLLILSAAGIGALLAALNVAYRDFRYIIPFMVQLWMYATPTIYFDLARVTNPNSKYAWLKQVLQLNPMTGLIASFRAGLLDQPIPWDMFVYSAASAVLFFFVGCVYFRSVEDSFADVL